jgi:hypothetical protein
MLGGAINYIATEFGRIAWRESGARRPLLLPQRYGATPSNTYDAGGQRMRRSGVRRDRRPRHQARPPNDHGGCPRKDDRHSVEPTPILAQTSGIAGLHRSRGLIDRAHRPGCFAAPSCGLLTRNRK